MYFCERKHGYEESEREKEGPPIRQTDRSDQPFQEMKGTIYPRAGPAKIRIRLAITQFTTLFGDNKSVTPSDRRSLGLPREKWTLPGDRLLETQEDFRFSETSLDVRVLGS